MKKILPLLMLIGFSSYSQTPKRIKFSYDPATGTQTQRFICLCPIAKVANDSIFKDLENISEEDLINDTENEFVKYYPNPVLEELYIRWTNTKNSYLIAIDLYSLNGQLIRHHTNLQNQETSRVTFYNLPDGYYNVILVYSNNDRKTLKVVKQK